ncbi:hypothetical protein CAEBREN_13334 [Caenorhabditis brenneri]|uniref:histone acetyltransferase n=1 Tax=Caenorhabditis brenneri TaxID=135651 RepID=G0P680_CAEBE|nr:hypothetical protein CAEBREN_13334 [Caenorhabditis brenneri]
MNSGHPPMERPLMTFKDMIVEAVRGSPEKRLKLKEIYEEIQRLHPYYESVSEPWKWQNTIRHNLTMHDCFVKENEGSNYAHYWTLDEEKLGAGARGRGRSRSMRRAPRNEDPNPPALDATHRAVDQFVAKGGSRRTRQKKEEAPDLDSDVDEAEEPEPVGEIQIKRKIQDPQSQKSKYLNADGTGPGCSNAPIIPQMRASRGMEDRNADGSGPGPSNAPARIRSLSSTPPPTPPVRPPPSSVPSGDEDEEDDCIRIRRPLQMKEGLGEFKCVGCESCGFSEEYKRTPLISDAPEFQIPPDARRIFEEAQKETKKQTEMSRKELGDVYHLLKPDTEPRLPRKIHFSKYLMETSYGSPFPRQYRHAKTLYICEFCMFYARDDCVMKMHANGKCPWRAPPGKEIYRKDNISIFEVDGHKQKKYCEAVSLLMRCFLSSITNFWDTDLFLFYVITHNDDVGFHFAGCFSKEKNDQSTNNLNCIVALPCYQDKGYGRFLIDVSYALSRKEKNWIQGPELPFSELGEKAYASYWRMAVAKALAGFKDDIEGGDGISVTDITHATGINVHDVLATLEAQQWIKLEKSTNKENVGDIGWDVDWKTVEDIMEQVRTSTRAQFDENYLDWEPTVRTLEQDGFITPLLDEEEVEEEEEEEDEEEEKEPVVKKSKKKNEKKKKKKKE